MDGGGGTPLLVLLTGAKKSGVPDELRATVWAFRISLSVIKFILKKKKMALMTPTDLDILLVTLFTWSIKKKIVERNAKEFDY